MNTPQRSGGQPLRRTEVVLFPEGTARQTVDLATWDYPDLTVFALMAKKRRLTKALTELQNAMTALIAAVRQGQPLPDECFIPDLWHYQEEFAHEEGIEMFDNVCAALWIAHRFYGGVAEHTFRNGIKGKRFTASRA
jgi:hypothetical protein